MNNQNDGKAVASLVLGIISLVFIFFGQFAFLGIIMAIIGLVLGIQVKKADPNNGKAKAGVVLSIIGLALCALAFLACVVLAGAIASLAF
jgi:hypothetical protein